MATTLAALSLVLALIGFFLLYLEINKIEKQILELQEQNHIMNNEVNKLKQQAKKKYYANQNKKQVIQG
jgi:hypothetical protein